MSALYNFVFTVQANLIQKLLLTLSLSSSNSMPVCTYKQSILRNPWTKQSYFYHRLSPNPRSNSSRFDIFDSSRYYK